MPVASIKLLTRRLPVCLILPGKLELWKRALNLESRGRGLLQCSSIYSLPGLVWRVILERVARAEEVEYLVPEANIRLRPVEKYPHGWGSWGQLSIAGVQWHAQLGALYCAVSLYFLLWFGQVYVLLTHSVSSQPVLCHRTHGSAQQGSHIAVGLNHPPAQAHMQRTSPVLLVWNRGAFYHFSHISSKWHTFSTLNL